MNHDSLLRKAKNRFEKQGYFCKPMVLDKSSIDIIAIKDEATALAIEIETGGSTQELRAGVGQAQEAIGWVHQSYILVPIRVQKKAMHLIQGTSIGLMSYYDNDIFIAKEANKLIPEKAKLNDILHRSVGSCWICGRTFNNVPVSPHQRERGILVDNAFSNKRLHRYLTQFTPQNERQYANRWVRICKICSNILGDAFSEFLKKTHNIKDKGYVFNFSKYSLNEAKKVIRQKKR